MQCPECDSTIRPGAAACFCGWKVPQTPKRTTFSQDAPGAPCAHSGCPHPAVVEIMLQTGWAKLCKAHDLFHAQLEADEFCRQKGLKTTAEKRAYVKEALAGFGKGPSPVDHWKRVLATSGLPEATYRLARQALKHLHSEMEE